MNYSTYEMMFILRPDLNQEQVKQQMIRYRDFLKEKGAQKVSMKVWGKRRLAYPIQKFQDGIYILTHYTGDGSQVAPIERDMRLGEEVIRYLTTKLKEDIEFEETEIVDVPVSQPQTEPILQSRPSTEASETQNTQPNPNAQESDSSSPELTAESLDYPEAAPIEG